MLDDVDVFILIVAFSLIPPPPFVFSLSILSLLPSASSVETRNPDTKPEIKNHYRGHKLSMWLSLIPQIHSPGDAPDLSMRHHHFIEDNPQFYDGKRIFCNHASRIVDAFVAGKIRLQSLVRPTVVKISAPPLTTATPKHKTEKTPSPIMPSMTTGEHTLCPESFAFFGAIICVARVSHMVEWSAEWRR